MRDVYGRVEEVVAGADIDDVRLEVSTVEVGIGTAEVVLRATPSELESKYVVLDGLSSVSSVEVKGLVEVGDGFVG